MDTTTALEFFIIGFAILFLYIGLMYMWEHMSYKITRMYRAIKKIYNDFELDEFEFEEQVNKGDPFADKQDPLYKALETEHRFRRKAFETEQKNRRKGKEDKQE